MALFYFTWPKPQYLPIVDQRTWGELDYVGSVLLIAASVLVVFPFQNVGDFANQWSKPVFIVPLLLGVLSWIALILWSIFIEWRWKDAISAAIPMRLLRDRIYASTVLNTLIVGFPYLVVIYTFPLRLQIVNGKDAFTAGLMLLPMLGATAVGSFISGAISRKTCKVFEMLLVGACLVLLGCGLLSTLADSHDLEPKALGFLVFVGLGFGMSVSTATMVAAFQPSAFDHGKFSVPSYYEYCF